MYFGAPIKLRLLACLIPLAASAVFFLLYAVLNLRNTFVTQIRVDVGGRGQLLYEYIIRGGLKTV